jgi:CelD/BcsL family acetyltransferase involved in cellulose biosynthesis
MDAHNADARKPVRNVGTCPTEVYQLQPLNDPRWADLVNGHPRSSVFHSIAWLKALQRTYGYDPIAFTTSPPRERLKNGIIFCRVASWMTGRRLVSLPFSDHCEPLVHSVSDEKLILNASEESLRQESLRYVEVRQKRSLAVTMSSSWHVASSYVLHELDLRPDLNTLFANFHKSSTQRKIRRAENEKLISETGGSEPLLAAFWDLLLITRRRHKIPPQPRNWFRNLIHCFGPALQIRVAFKDKTPVASIITIRHKKTLVYKYGCSDARFNSLGGNHLLFWDAIQEAKRQGLETFDFGRSDCSNPGLLAFKDRWGGARSPLMYSRFSDLRPSNAGGLFHAEWMSRIGKSAIPYLPACVLRMAGSALYRHIA